MPARPRRTVAAGIAALGAVGLVSGCGGDEQPAGPPTVTITPTVTASGEGSGDDTSTAQAPSSTAAPKPPASDVKGRAYDLGTITKVSSAAGVEVIELDRWTVKGLDDALLAGNGYPVRIIAKSPFSNQNASLTYGIPLTEDATVLFHHCVAKDDPMQTRSATAKELAGLQAPENVVVAELDDQGRATSLQNYPVCGS